MKQKIAIPDEEVPRLERIVGTQRLDEAVRASGFSAQDEEEFGFLLEAVKDEDQEGGEEGGEEGEAGGEAGGEEGEAGGEAGGEEGEEGDESDDAIPTLVEAGAEAGAAGGAAEQAEAPPHANREEGVDADAGAEATDDGVKSFFTITADGAEDGEGTSGGGGGGGEPGSGGGGGGEGNAEGDDEEDGPVIENAEEEGEEGEGGDGDEFDRYVTSRRPPRAIPLTDPPPPRLSSARLGVAGLPRRLFYKYHRTRHFTFQTVAPHHSTSAGSTARTWPRTRASRTPT